jgi:hypothetical protein
MDSAQLVCLIRAIITEPAGRSVCILTTVGVDSLRMFSESHAGWSAYVQ